MKLYVYEKQIGNIKAILGVIQTKRNEIINKFAYVIEWFSIGILFYLNSAFIHSRLFSIFIFICGVVLMKTIGTKKEVVSKDEFLKKVNEIVEEA